MNNAVVRVVCTASVDKARKSIIIRIKHKGNAPKTHQRTVRMKKRRSGTIYEKYVKRALDVVLACFLLTAFCWLYAIVAIVVKLDLG